MKLGPHPFSLRQLQYAVAVAESLNFRNAAERCHVSQPSLSAQLAQMEKVLGFKLFERDRRSVLVTTAGRGLIEHARLILRETDNLVEFARQSGNPLAGTLRLGVIPTISPYLLPRLASALHKAYPLLTVLWVEDKTEPLVSSLNAGSLDAALLANEANIGDVECEVIGPDPFVLATPVGHPLGTPASPARVSDLREASVLLLDEGHCFREQALAFCSGAKAHELEFRATSLSTLVQMVALGVGVTLLPEIAVPTEARRAVLSIRPFARPAPGRTIALVWRKRSPLGPALRRLAGTTRAAYGRSASSPRKGKGGSWSKRGLSTPASRSRRAGQSEAKATARRGKGAARDPRSEIRPDPGSLPA
jgi:LysR family transcriptional regulator, hydrogen peroxide-inducible genes activator